eukprot:NODE_2543_length_2192_cov_3.675545.p1 GENE.NODE_2543_length_2192_cov_3.675545~~NODE_2543_length_2192_cov_3.675545.p1  ORF type:complete len:298 (-),score=31.88 NODE_2543_length_2192_cov_3.675545:669-1562(-)
MAAHVDRWSHCQHPQEEGAEELLRHSRGILLMSHAGMPLCRMLAMEVSSRGPGGSLVLDLTFVDDEAVMVADSPGAVLAAVDSCMAMLALMLRRQMLEINWKPGKTEFLLRLRGQGSTRTRESLRQADGHLRIPVHSADGLVFVNVVNRYVHLGTVLTPDGSYVLNARRTATRANEAYGPLALRIFGAPNLSVELRLMFADSFVSSRLCYNIGLRAPSRRALRIMANAYMRGLRRVAGHSRFERGGCTLRLGGAHAAETPLLRLCVCARAAPVFRPSRARAAWHAPRSAVRAVRGDG